MNSEGITLPAGTPLMCDVEEAAKLFGISRTTLYGLVKLYPDFPVKMVGRGVRYLVPDMYAWFREFPDKTIPTEKSAAQRGLDGDERIRNCNGKRSRVLWHGKE